MLRRRRAIRSRGDEGARVVSPGRSRAQGLESSWEARLVGVAESREQGLGVTDGLGRWGTVGLLGRLREAVTQQQQRVNEGGELGGGEEAAPASWQVRHCRATRTARPRAASGGGQASLGRGGTVEVGGAAGGGADERARGRRRTGGTSARSGCPTRLFSQRAFRPFSAASSSPWTPSSPKPSAQPAPAPRGRRARGGSE